MQLKKNWKGIEIYRFGRSITQTSRYFRRLWATFQKTLATALNQQFPCKSSFQLKSSIMFNMLCEFYSSIYFQNFWEETFFKKNRQIFDRCSTTTCNNSCMITFFVCFYHSVHFTRFNILWFNKSLPIFVNGYTSYPSFNSFINFILKAFCRITISK